MRKAVLVGASLVAASEAFVTPGFAPAPVSGTRSTPSLLTLKAVGKRPDVKVTTTDEPMAPGLCDVTGRRLGTATISRPTGGRAPPPIAANPTVAASKESGFPKTAYVARYYDPVAAGHVQASAVVRQTQAAGLAAAPSSKVEQTTFLGSRTLGKMMKGIFGGSSATVTADDLRGAQKMIDDILLETNANPLMVRLAWHDSGTFDASISSEWPAAGGAIGSIRFKPEIEHGANAGLASAVQMLEPVKAKFPKVSYADLFQMASARAIELAGGPPLNMRYGRVDAAGPDNCSPEGNLPDAEAGPSGKYGGTSGTKPTEDTTPNGHLRKVFYRMGLDDEAIVALSGAHTLGRAYKDRSGLGAEKTKFTDGSVQTRADGTEAKYKAGGSSWTKQWLKFDNSYFTTLPDPSADPELLKLSSDRTLFEDAGFKTFAEKFRDSEAEFFASYAAAHVELSELGSKFVPEGGIRI